MREWKDKAKKEKNKDNFYNNRINIVLAIVFLLGGSMVYQLYDLQIKKHDLYKAMASSQHQVTTELEPERGEILIKSEGKKEKESNDKEEDAKSDLYPLATNKDYALIYAIPKEVEKIAKRKEYAEKIYKTFDKKRVKKKVKEYFKKKDKRELRKKLENIPQDLSAKERQKRKEEIKREHQRIRGTEEWQKERKEDIEQRIEKKKEKLIEKYLKIYKKRDDPYEPLKKKVPRKKAREFYAALMTKDIDPDELALRNRQVFEENASDPDKELSTPQRKLIRIKGISHILKNYRYYSEEEMGANFLGFVSHEDNKMKGNYGLEGFFNKELQGEEGSATYGKGAREDVIIVNDREYVAPEDGSDLVLTLNGTIQFATCRKLKKGIKKYQADGGSVVAVNPETGGIISMCSYPSFNPNNYGEVKDMSVYNNPVVFEQYEPGSVFKTITMAAALNEGAITPKTTYVDKGKVMVEGWDEPITNATYRGGNGHGKVTMNYVLEKSLNTGAIYAMRQIGPQKFADYVKRFGFGQQTGIELEAEGKGDISSLRRENIPEVYAATASFGQGISVTPLQMVMSYAAIANDGVLMKPFLVKNILKSNGKKETTHPIQRKKVISEKTSTLLSGMLVNVIEGGHAKKAAVDGYHVGGKTGTAQVASNRTEGYSKKTVHSFIGMAPIDDPRFVMLVKLDNPERSYSASTAAPLFGNIAEFMLDYYEVPKER